MDLARAPRRVAASLAVVSKLAQREGTINKDLSGCILMKLHGC